MLCLLGSFAMAGIGDDWERLVLKVHKSVEMPNMDECERTSRELGHSPAKKKTIHPKPKRVRRQYDRFIIDKFLVSILFVGIIPGKREKKPKRYDFMDNTKGKAQLNGIFQSMHMQN